MPNIDDMTLGELKKLSSLFAKNTETNYEPGQKYFIRTVTMHHVGELVSVNDRELKLKNASWVADSGRFYTALKTGNLNEVEPFLDEVIIPRDSVIDATIWRHSLPVSQK